MAAATAPAAVLLGDAGERILEFLDAHDLAELACASKAFAARVRPRATALRARRHQLFTDEGGLTAVLLCLGADGAAELAAPRLVCKAWCRAADPHLVRPFRAIEARIRLRVLAQALAGYDPEMPYRPPRPGFLPEAVAPPRRMQPP